MKGSRKYAGHFLKKRFRSMNFRSQIDTCVFGAGFMKSVQPSTRRNFELFQMASVQPSTRATTKCVCVLPNSEKYSHAFSNFSAQSVKYDVLSPKDDNPWFTEDVYEHEGMEWLWGSNWAGNPTGGSGRTVPSSCPEFENRPLIDFQIVNERKNRQNLMLGNIVSRISQSAIDRLSNSG